MALNTKVLTLAIFLVTVSHTTVTHARIKCWTNNDGIKECGDTVPPEFSQKGHQEISEQGVVVDEQERAKTEQELEEQRKLEAAQAEQERIAAEKEKQDQILLHTFGSVDDIHLTRDGQLTAIESSITLANKRNEKLQADMDHMLQRAAQAESKGEAPPETLLKSIDEKEKQIDNNNKFIEDRRAEQEAIKLEYEEKIARYKELKGIEETEEIDETDNAEE